MTQEKLPTQIDEAKILFITKIDKRHRSTGATRHIVNDRQMKEPYGLALCSYEEDPGFYLFYCNSNWEAMNDSYHDTIDLAKEQAEFEFVGTKNTWIAREN